MSELRWTNHSICSHMLDVWSKDRKELERADNTNYVFVLFAQVSKWARRSVLSTPRRHETSPYRDSRSEITSASSFTNFGPEWDATDPSAAAGPAGSNTRAERGTLQQEVAQRSLSEETSARARFSKPRWKAGPLSRFAAGSRYLELSFAQRLGAYCSRYSPTTKRPPCVDSDWYVAQGVLGFPLNC